MGFLDSMTCWVVFLAGISVVLGTSVPVKRDEVCFGNSNANRCSQHQLQCEEGTIFILKAQRGFKPATSRCLVQRKLCNEHIDSCCRFHDDDCLEDFSRNTLLSLEDLCQNRSSCTFAAGFHESRVCSADYKDVSGYSVVTYLCLSLGASLPTVLEDTTTSVATRKTTLSTTSAEVTSDLTSVPSTSDPVSRGPSKDGTSHKSTLSGGAVGAVVAAVLMVVLTLAVVFGICYKRKWMRRSPPEGAGNSRYSSLSASTMCRQETGGAYVTVDQKGQDVETAATSQPDYMEILPPLGPD